MAMAMAMAIAINISPSTSPLMNELLPITLSPSSTSPLLNKPNPSRVSIRCRFTTPRTASSASTYRSSFFHLESTVAGSPTSVPVRVAHELLQAGHHYLDVRTPEEFSAGHVDGAVNVPYLFRVGSGMAKNTHFIPQVSSYFDKDDEILIGCQSGKRSLMAANDLLSVGYSGIMDIAGGYDAWIQGQLPAQV